MAASEIIMHHNLSFLIVGGKKGRAADSNYFGVPSSKELVPNWALVEVPRDLTLETSKT